MIEITNSIGSGIDDGSYIQLPGLWDDAVLAGIAGDESLLHRPAQSDVEHQVDAVDCGSAESFALALSNLDSAAF